MYFLCSTPQESDIGSQDLVLKLQGIGSLLIHNDIGYAIAQDEPLGVDNVGVFANNTVTVKQTTL